MTTTDRPERLSPAEFACSSELARLMSSAGIEEELGERPLEILLVEDRGDPNQSFSLPLEQEGYRVTSALNQSSALQEYARCEPDLVLLDLSLPEMNGLELLRQFHRQPGHETIPVVVITASDDPVLEVEARLWGARDVVHKPVSARRLLGTVQTFAAGDRGNGASG